MLSNTRFIFLLGPTCVGKGFLIKLVLRILVQIQSLMGLKVELISFGQIIRDLLEKDPDFKERYGASIARGELLDDPMAIELFSKKIDELCAAGIPDIILVDGFCRTKIQIEYSIQNGYLQEKDTVCIIGGSFDTCFKRFANRKTRDTSRSETEIETFRSRYHLHTDSIGDLRALFKDCEAREIDIDGNKDIPEFVGPALTNELLPVFFQSLLAKKMSSVSV